MSNIKEHEINKQDDLFIKGYYAPDDVINPAIDWANTLELRGGASLDTSTGKLVNWDGKTHVHKECIENDITWPTLNVPEVKYLLDWIQFALDNYMDAYPMICLLYTSPSPRD